MIQYLDLLKDVLENGVSKTDRTGVGTRSVFARSIRCDLRKGFPLLTTKKMHTKSIIHELLWFLKGEGNIKYLKENGVTIWDEWANKDGDLGPVYGVQWRKWKTFSGKFLEEHQDQIKNAIDLLKKTPDSRRNIVSAWNVTDLPQMALPPCHVMFQLYAVNGELSLLMFQRSADLFLGVPFNIASYGFLTHMIAQVTGLKAKELIINFGDLHIYNNHFEQVKLQLSREPKKLPMLELEPSVTDIDDFKFEHFKLANYERWPTIKAPIAV